MTFSYEPFAIIRGDAIEVLKQLPTKVDCVITSPPYYLQRNYGTSAGELGREASVAEYIGNLVDVFRAIPLEPWASIWVNIGDKRGKQGELLGIPERFVAAMNDAGFYRIDNVIWAKESVQVDGQSVGHCMIEPAPRRLNGNAHEPFYRFVVDPKRAWSDTCAVRIPRKNVADIRYLPEELMRCHTSLEGRNLSNVWSVPMGQTRKSHYAVFPIAWEPDLPAIRRGIVLDPFCGSGSTGEVALKLGRDFIGIELYENYAQIAEDRCRQAHLLRSEFEAKNPVKASTPSFDIALNDPMPDEVQFEFDFFDAGVPWEAASDGGL